MSLLDSQNELSNKQTLIAAVGTHVSTNVIDLSVDRDIGKGEPVPFLAQITTLVESGGAATLQLILETDDNEAMASAETLYTSEVITLAALVAGYKFPINFVPRTNQQYLRASYVIGTADITAGAIQCSIGSEDQTNLVNV